ncbi:MAG: hypothetical protein JNK58_12075 [Phycisphaerae bacterium]|nr:hypothetical protein [Phycisphaerae bacterium]
MTGAGFHLRVLGVLALAAEVCAQPAPGDAGEDGGPVVVGTSRESWTGFELERLDAALEFRMEYQDDRLRQKGQREERTRELRLRELLNLSGEAVIGHRNLFDLTGTVQLGYEDIDTESSLDDLDGRESNFVNLYDLSGLLLGTSAAPTTIYARREQSLLDRPFAGTIDQIVMEEGINTRIQSAVAPTSLLYFHRDESLTGDFGDIDTDVSQDTFSFQNALVINDAQRLETIYTFDHISESQAGGYFDEYDRHDANVVHTLRFGEELQPHELRSSLRYYGQSGRQDRQDLRLDELLTLRHTDRLESRYNLTHDARTVRGESQSLTRGEASVKHRLFDSLTTVGRAGGQHFEAPGGATSNSEFISGQVDYTKKVPYGRLELAGGLAFDAQQNSERGSTVQVIDEPHVFIDGFPIILPRRNIVANSIVVTPEAGFPIYQEGFDYTVQVFSDHAEIRGILGGGFVNGQLLRISYDVGPEPGNDIDTFSTNISFRFSITEGWLRGLALYATYRTVDHSVQADNPDEFLLDDLKDLLLGTEYRIGGFEARAEYNDHDSEFDPYNLIRFRAAYSLRINTDSTLVVDASRELIDFRREDNEVTFDRASLRWNSRVDRSLDWNVTLQYRNEDSSRDGQTEALEQVIGLSWHKRQTSVHISFRNAFIDGPGSEQTSQYLQFELKRTF